VLNLAHLKNKINIFIPLYRETKKKQRLNAIFEHIYKNGKDLLK
jgi:hypothetical protein